MVNSQLTFDNVSEEELTHVPRKISGITKCSHCDEENCKDCPNELFWHSVNESADEKVILECNDCPNMVNKIGTWVCREYNATCRDILALCLEEKYENIGVNK